MGYSILWPQRCCFGGRCGLVISLLGMLAAYKRLDSVVGSQQLVAEAEAKMVGFGGGR